MRKNENANDINIVFLPSTQANIIDFNNYGKRLTDLGELGQYARQGDNFYTEKSIQIDRANLKELKRLIKKYGFPEITKVGKKAYLSAYLIAQHAGHDLDFMKFFLSEVTKRLHTVAVINKTYGYLFDRVNRMEGRPLLYGTQGGCFDGIYVPSQPISLVDLDQTRAALGLLSMKAFSEKVCR